MKFNGRYGHTQRTVTQRCDNKRSAKRGAHSVSPLDPLWRIELRRMRWKARQLSAGILNGWRRLGSAPRKRLSGRLLRGKKNLQDLLYPALNPFNDQSEKNNNFYTVRSHNRWNSNCSGRWGFIKLAADPPKIIFRDYYMYVRDVCGTGCSKSAQTSVCMYVCIYVSEHWYTAIADSFCSKSNRSPNMVGVLFFFSSQFIFGWLV